MTVLIAVWGVSPGVGKSTLCAGLSRWLTDAGLRVDHFREEEILTRPQFAAVAEAFKTTGTVGLRTLITASAEFVDSVLARRHCPELRGGKGRSGWTGTSENSPGTR